MAETQTKGMVYLMKGNGLLYVGSTTQGLKRRFAEHQSDYRCDRGCSSKLLFEGDNEVTIEPLEEVVGDLKAREKYWIEQYECVNIICTGRSRAEHYQVNKEHLNQISRAYHEANRERIRERRSAYCNVKYQCPCTGTYTYKNHARHLKTKIHQLYLDNLK